jgi:hypothetical protein
MELLVQSGRLVQLGPWVLWGSVFKGILVTRGCKVTLGPLDPPEILVSELLVRLVQLARKVTLGILVQLGLV